MNRRRFHHMLWMLPAAVGFGLALGQPVSVLAAEMRSGNDITVGPNETIDDDLYAFGANIIIQGKVTGSVIAGGNSVTVSGDVGGDVMAAGSTIVIDGPVHGSVRAAGQSVQVRASVDHDLIAAGNSVGLLGNARVGRDLMGAGTSVTIAGPVGRDVNASGTTVGISSSVGGQVKSNSTNLRLDPSARVQGGVAYTSENQADIAPGATVVGTVTRTEPAQPQTAPAGLGVLDWLKGLVGLCVLGVALLFLSPRAVERNSEILLRSPWVSLGLGALVIVAAPILAVAVFAAGLLLGGWWLGLLVLGAAVLWLLLGYLASAATLGSEVLVRLQRPGLHRAWGFLAGLVILAILQLVPFLGGLVALVALLMGSGALVLSVRALRARTTGLTPRSAAPPVAVGAPSAVPV